jgi:hypothetical protein
MRGSACKINVTYLQQTSTKNVKIIISVDERLTEGGVVLEGTNAELTAGNCQIESRSSCRGECDADVCSEGGYAVASYSVGSIIGSSCLDIGRNKLIDSLNGV